MSESARVFEHPDLPSVDIEHQKRSAWLIMLVDASTLYVASCFSEFLNKKKTFFMYRRTFNRFVQVRYNGTKLTSARMSLTTARTPRKRAGT